MIIFPGRERFIRKHFFEYSFNSHEDEDVLPDFEKLDTLSSAEQYYLVTIFNWDDGVEVLKRIVQSPKCDKGTAGLIFWEAQPDFYIHHTLETIPDYEIEVFEMLQLITKRFSEKSFRTALFSYIPNSCLKDIDFNKTYQGWSLPSELQFRKWGINPLVLRSRE